MELNSDALAGWRRCFLPQRPEVFAGWVGPAAGPELGFAGPGVEAEAGGCRVSVPSVRLGEVGEARVAVENLGQESLTLELDGSLEGVRAGWENGGSSFWLDRGGGRGELRLVVALPGAEPSRLVGTLWVEAEDGRGERRRFAVEVDAASVLAAARGRFRFHGETEPPLAAFAFGTVSSTHALPRPSAYSVSVETVGSVPLTLEITEVPAWLSVESTSGSLAAAPHGSIRLTAPVTFAFRPRAGAHLLGALHGSVCLRTNDDRPVFQELRLPFSALFERDEPQPEQVPLESVPLEAVPLVGRVGEGEISPAAESDIELDVVEGFALPRHLAAVLVGAGVLLVLGVLALSVLSR